MRSERAALVAAIHEAPDDDTRRLVCADWFEERGDEAGAARAEFIRVQVERANLPPEDPRQGELEARELRLLRRWGPVWCGSHFVFKKVRFRRGFIEYVHLHLRHFLHHRRQMFALEPVRDVRLTGWFRATADLVRRVAQCEEWRHVEMLRIHHQGPHKSPRGDVVALLESPHLTRLRTLHLPMVAFDADARRRFERLPVLQRVAELTLPMLDTFPQNPGEWFSDGGAVPAERWDGLRSLALPYYLQADLLRRFTVLPFWSRLTGLSLTLPWQSAEALAVLRDRMPPGLRELTIQVTHAPADLTGIDSFFDRLARVPLEKLHLSLLRITPTALGRLLDGTNRWHLRELSLIGCDLNADHARVLARSPGASGLRVLNLAGNRDLTATAAEDLFSTDRFESVASLDLRSTRIGNRGVRVLAAAGGWSRLRWLNLSDVGLGVDGLRALVRSPIARGLTGLAVGTAGYPGEQDFDLPPDLAAELTRLSHLTRLHLSLRECDPRTVQILSECESLAWPWVESWETFDVQRYRANRAPGRWPPVDGPDEDPLAEP
jgi:uncharacterized protein (TIGR02996 family)